MPLALSWYARDPEEARPMKRKHPKRGAQQKFCTNAKGLRHASAARGWRRQHCACKSDDLIVPAENVTGDIRCPKKRRAPRATRTEDHVINDAVTSHSGARNDGAPTAVQSTSMEDLALGRARHRPVERVFPQVGPLGKVRARWEQDPKAATRGRVVSGPRVRTGGSPRRPCTHAGPSLPRHRRDHKAQEGVSVPGSVRVKSDRVGR